MVASLLGSQEADELHCDQHLLLLSWLVDEALCTETLRDTLTQRMEEVEDAKRELREGMAEDRRKLKELVEADKEERRKKREAEAARRDALVARRKVLEEQAAKAAAEGKEVPDIAKILAVEAAALLGGAGEEDVDEAAALARFELPPELQVYSGDPGDRKALIQFRQRQQDERRRLDKAKQTWLVAHRQRKKDREAEKKAAAEAEKTKQREREAAEEKLLARQEAYEREIEKYAVRRLPLGCDRKHRRYWWGLAGNRTALFVQDASDGSWGAFKSPEELDGLMDALDKRGVREAGLLEALEKRYRGVQDALRREARKEAAAAPSKDDPQSAPVHPPERQQPVRKGKPAELRVDGASTSTAAAKDKAVDKVKESEGRIGGFEGAALDHAAAEMGELAQEAASFKVPLPDGVPNWNKWAVEVEAMAEGRLGELASTPPGPKLSAAVRRALQQRLLELEAAVWAASKDGKAAAEGKEVDEEEEEEEDSDEDKEEGSGEEEESSGDEMYLDQDAKKDAAALLSPGALMASIADEQDRAAAQRRDKTRLWTSRKQRELWQADVAGACTAPRLAYCASLINEVGQEMLDALKGQEARSKHKDAKAKDKPKAGSGGAGATKGGSAAAAAAAGGSKRKAQDTGAGRRGKRAR